MYPGASSALSPLFLFDLPKGAAGTASTRIPESPPPIGLFVENQSFFALILRISTGIKLKTARSPRATKSCQGAPSPIVAPA